MTAILALVLKYLPQLIQATGAVPQLIGLVKGLHDIFARKNIWTAEQKAQFEAETAEMRSKPEWQITD